MAKILSQGADVMAVGGNIARPVPVELWNPETYDKLRRQLIPSFDLLYDSAANVVSMCVHERARILDLGAGTGLLTEAVVKRLPKAEVLLVDRSELMLRQALSRFAGTARVRTRVADLTDPLPEGPFHAVISALAIHHLPHQAKRALFGRIYDVLSPSGLFVNVEQVAAPTMAVEGLYDRQHERHVVASDTPPEEWEAGRERMKFDICAGLEAQMQWLREARFSTVDCLAKDWRFTTYAAWKAPS